MKLYTKIINEETKEILITNQIEARQLGYEEMEIEFSEDGKGYLKGYLPQKSLEEIKKEKIEELDNFLLDKITEIVKKEYDIDINFMGSLSLQKIFKICRKLNKSFEELIKIIENIFNQVKSIQDDIENKINSINLIEKINTFSIEKEYNKLVKENNGNS